MIVVLNVAVTFLSGITRNVSKSTLLSGGPHFRQVCVSFKGPLFSGGGRGAGGDHYFQEVLDLTFGVEGGGE